MAVSEQTPYIEYTANGVTTSFALGFDCDKQDHLIVTVNDVEPIVGSWSLTGGTVVFLAAPINNAKIIIQRNTPFERNTDYQSYNNSFRPPSVNKDFDWIWWKLQELGVTDWLLQQNIDNLKTYVDDRDDELRAYLLEEIRKQGVALDQLDEYYNYLMQRLAQIAVDKGWDASFITDASGQTQQQINDAQKIINNVVNKLDGDFVFVEHYYAKGGALRPVSDLYTVGSDVYNSQFTDFASVQAYFPHVTAPTDPLDWAATQKAVNENYSVRFRDVFYYFGTKTLEIPTACSQLLGQGILTRIYSDASIAIKAKSGVRVIGGLYGDFYLLGSSVASSIGFDASAFSYNTFRNMYIRLFNDGWYADGSITPVNKQYSNNTVINVRSNNNLRDGFRLVGSSVANSANTYVGCEAAGNENIGFNETVGYSNQTVGCTFQGNTVFDLYSDGERNIHEYYAEGNPKSSKLGTLSKNNIVSIRSSYPLWNSFINDGQANNVSVRGDISVDHHVFYNPYFEDWAGASPTNVAANGSPVFSFYSDANTRLGGGLQAVFNANFQGIILQGLDPTIDYAGRWVTVQIEADTSGITDLSGLRVYTRDGSTNNGATGEFASASWTQTTAGKYKNFTFDVKFAATLTSTPTVLIYLAYSGITTTNTIKIKAIKLILGQKDRVSDYALSIPTRTSVAANFTSATSGLNTAFKYAGKVVFNSTASKVYYASGATATSAWKALDGTADIVPA